MRNRHDIRNFRSKKDVKNKYDPQIARAAAAQTALAQRAQEFAEEFQTEYVVPLIGETIASSQQERMNQGKLFDLNYGQALRAEERFTKYGIPAEERYYRMVDEYDEGREAERRAREALGDVRTAFDANYSGLMRQQRGLGIDPTSGTGIAVSRDWARDKALAEATAMTRARGAARDLGIGLTADAANFGRGGASTLQSFAQGAGANSQAGFGITQGALGTVGQSAGVPMQGYGIAQQAYSSNLNAYAGLGRTSMQASAQAGSGVGSFLGKIAGFGLSKL